MCCDFNIELICLLLQRICLLFSLPSLPSSLPLTLPPFMNNEYSYKLFWNLGSRSSCRMNSCSNPMQRYVRSEMVRTIFLLFYFHPSWYDQKCKPNITEILPQWIWLIVRLTSIYFVTRKILTIFYYFFCILCTIVSHYIIILRFSYHIIRIKIEGWNLTSISTIFFSDSKQVEQNNYLSPVSCYILSLLFTALISL